MLVDFTDFLVRDANDIAGRLRPGSYRFDADAQHGLHADDARVSEEHRDGGRADVRAQRGGAAGGPGGPAADGGGGGGAFFEGVGSVAATGEAASIRVHHSIVELPDANYKPRASIRAPATAASTYEDFAAPLGQPMTKRFIRRHRSQKKDPAAAVSEPVKPIIYYVDPGAPEPIRSALLDGARWWNQAFEAAGYRNAFQVELLPEGVSPLDIRYNVINWVHRSTRGWSTGGSVTDPRTGEIIKGVVTLGSLRVRQDYMIARRPAQPLQERHRDAAGADRVGARAHPPALGARGRPHARPRPQLLRQRRRPHLGDGLSASARHAEGATARSTTRRSTTSGSATWDKVAIPYGYSDFPAGTDEASALASDPRGRSEEGPALHDEPGHRREPARRSVVERHRRRPPS